VAPKAWLGPAVLLLSLAGLGVGWAVTNPIGAAPDEPAHYIKALAVGQGEWLGNALAPGEKPVFAEPVRDALNTLRYVPQLTRRVSIPAQLEPDKSGCTAFNPVPATCVAAAATVNSRWGNGSAAYTYLGTYQPFVYVLPGLAMHLAATPLQAFIIGRLAFGAIALLLIGLGALLCFEIAPRRAMLVGILASLTPMVVFTSATVSASSSEIAGGVAVSGAVLHLAYEGPHRRVAWLTLAVGGAVLACSRALGPVWVAIFALAMLSLIGWRRTWLTWRGNVRWSVPTAAVLAAACAASLGWQFTVQPRPVLDLHTMALGFIHSFDTVPGILQQEIGIFGWLDTAQVGPSYIIWGGLVWSLLTLAMFLGSTRERWTLGWLVILNLVLTPLVYPTVAAPAGVGVQGRWLLPVAVSVPMLAGVIVARRTSITRVANLVTLGAVAAIAMVQFLAIYQNARRYAVGSNGALLFFQKSQWTAPGGWMVWLVLALLSCAGLVAAAIIMGRDRHREWPASATLDPART
jgi:hypothetical protein